MSAVPSIDNPTALRRFLQTQSMATISSDLMSTILAQMRRFPDNFELNSVPLENLSDVLDAILLARADNVLLQDRCRSPQDGELPWITKEAFFARYRPQSSTPVLCGYLFQRNDIVFNCKTCQSDETCVLCLQCFQNGNHDGHDVYFHRTSPGGVCDCGDSEAWAPEGFCKYHGQQKEDLAPATRTEATASLPEDLVHVATALFQAIVDFYVEMATQSMQVFDADIVDAKGRERLQKGRQQMHQEERAVEDVQRMERQFHVRICNDDVHSDEDLIRSLSQKGISQAEDLVRAIDSNGSELVARNLLLRDALTLMQALKGEGWHVAVVQDQFVHDEDVLLRVTQWMKTVCAMSKQLHELFCHLLFATERQPKEPIQVMFLSDPYFRKDIVLELYELYLKLQGEKAPKVLFSLVFLKVYNRMMLKYFCGVGTREESLFQYGVQILTTPSIVHQLAKKGLLEMLLDTINTALEMARTYTVPLPPPHTVYRTLDCDHPLLKFKRYHFVIENFGYVLGIPAMSSALLLRSEILEKWLRALADIQGLDPQVRIQDGRAHVTYETHSWLTAFTFHANVSKVHALIAKGLRYHEAVDTDTCNHERERMVLNILAGFWGQMKRSDMATTQLQLYASPCSRLLGSSGLETIVKYDVLTQPVSFHNPLHGLLASCLIESMYYGPLSASGSTEPWISSWTTLFERSMTTSNQQNGLEDGKSNEIVRQMKTRMIYTLMEFPLRSLVLCAHIGCGLWIRNGQNMQRQMLNYTSPPWCNELRDLDLFLVQVSATIVGFATFLTIFFDRFGLAEWLVAWANLRKASDESSSVAAREAFVSASEDEKLVGVLEAALLQLLWIVTELMPSPDAIQQRDAILRREIIHRLSQHPCRLSELLDQTAFVVSTPFGGISNRQEKQHLTRLEHILNEVADVQVKRSGLVPSLGDGADEDESMGPGSMEPTTYILKKAFFKEYDPSFYHLSRSSHEKAQFARHEALFKAWKVEDSPIPFVTHLSSPHKALGTVRFLVLEKGLLGILRLVLEDANCSWNQETSCNRGGKRTNVMALLRAIHLLNVAVLVLQCGGEAAALVQEKDAVLSASKRHETVALLRRGPEAFEEADTASRGKKRVKRQTVATAETENVPLNRESNHDDKNDVHDLSIVALLVALSKDMIQNDFETSKSTISCIYWILKEVAKLDRLTQAYVELQVWSGMKKHKELVTEKGMSKDEVKKLYQQRAIAAMTARQTAFAQSKAFAEMDDQDEGDLIGSGSSGKSSAATLTDSKHTIVYRPPPPPDCIICSQKEKDEPIMYIGHAQRTKVNVHAFAKLPGDTEPDVAGNNHSVSCTAAFPPSIHLSLCGHAVHLHCWQKYFASVRAQSRVNHEHSQTNIAFDAHVGEFLCPLCQALSSMLIPCLPVSPPLTSIDQQRDRNAMERVFQSKQDTASIFAWLSTGLPSRLDTFAALDDTNRGAEDNQDETIRSQQHDEVRAMKQFAVNFLETLSRFQAEKNQLTSATSALKDGFYSTGAQVTHLIWSSVTSTIANTQLSGISAAIYSFETSATLTKSGHKGTSWQSNPGFHSRGNASSATTASSFSSLRISNILNPAVQSLRARVAVSLPEALDPQLDQFTPKDDSKLNVLLRALRHTPFLFPSSRRGFYQSLCFPIAQNFRLALSLDQWLETLPQGPPLQLGLPILSQDLFYLCVAICSSMLTTKAEILLTIRSLCILYMAQVLLQLAQMEAEDEDDDEVANEVSNERRQWLDTKDSCKEMQRGLETLMARLAHAAGVTCIQDLEEGEARSTRRPAPQGRQLQLLFESSCLAFMRQVTLLCRAFFRGEDDPDVSWSANFVSSLRLSTKYHEMCQQLGLPRISQLLADDQLLDYLVRAARELCTRITSAAVSKEAQVQYQQLGKAEQLIAELRHLGANQEKHGRHELAMLARSTLQSLPRLPLRCDPDGRKCLFHVANIRLVKLAQSYTNLHAEVLGKSKCKQTWKTVENPAICLLCEHVLCAGTECCRRRSDGMGACTHHAMTCGAGVGLYFLMRSSSVLLVFGPRSSYFGSPYLDMFGEEDINVRRGRPLYLNAKRMKALQALYANHQVANEVTRNRRTSEQYIRNNYY